MAQGSNPFYVQPMGDMTQGLQGLGQGLGSLAQAQQARAMQEQEQAKRKEMGRLFNAGSPQEIAAFALQNPEFGQQLKQGLNFRDEPIRNMYVNSFYAAKEDPSKIPTLINAYEARLKIDGYTEEEAQEIEGLRQGFATDPDKTLRAMEMDVAFLDTDKYNQYAKMTAEPEVDTMDIGDLEIGYRTYLSANEKENSSENYAEYNKFKITQKKALEKEPIERPYIAGLMSEGWVPSSRITTPMLDAYEAAAQRASENGEPLSVEDLYDFEFRAVGNRATGQSSGSRLVLARKQNIEAANGLLADLKATSKKLDYSPVKFIASLDKFQKGQLQDPIFIEYMTQRADALFILGNALKQNGLTDKSIEVEEEAFSPTLSPQAFDAWYNTQLRALNRAAEEMNADFKYGISQSPTFPAGQGGAPTAENPVPTMPEEQEAAQSMGRQTISSQAEFDALPSGSTYINKNTGKTMRKP